MFACLDTSENGPSKDWFRKVYVLKIGLLQNGNLLWGQRLRLLQRVLHGDLGSPPLTLSILSEFCQNFVRILSKFCQNFVKISSNFSKIFINFCIQYSIFQHFSKSTRFCKFLQKILQNFAKILRISENFAKFSEKLIVKILAKFSKFLAEICKICSREDDFPVDLENAAK